MKKAKVVVGMSGGVDSSVAAFLLKQQGYDVIGVTMEIWPRQDYESSSREGGCCGLSAVSDARMVADKIGIPYYVMNFKDIFREKVIDDFVNEYTAGRTPNPCIRCNRYVKWEALLERSLQIGADFIATGHYARVEKTPGGRYAIKKSVTDSKDQTYALYNLTQEQLSRTLMPVGVYEKDEVRKIAQEAGLMVAKKPDSMEICFVEDNDYAGFIKNYRGGEDSAAFRPGNFVDVNGKILGQHRGIANYTIGQRKGLNLALGQPVYVLGIKPETNEVVVGENSDLFTTVAAASNLNHMSGERFDENKRYLGKIRYNHRGTYCRVRYAGDDSIICEFEEPVRAVTGGQALVLYDGDYVAGGGILD